LSSAKIPPRGVEPLKGNHQAANNKTLTENQNPVLSTGLDNLLQKYPDLRQIVKVWPELSKQDKKTIMAPVKKHITEKK